MPKRSWLSIWPAAVALTVLALLASVAGAASRSDEIAATSVASTRASTETSASDRLSANASATAVEQTGERSSANEEKSDKNKTEANEDEGNAKDNDRDEIVDLTPKSTPALSTGSARPGFGCGDANHTHSGPPGRPGATPPPGCAKAHQGTSHSTTSTQTTTTTTTTTTTPTSNATATNPRELGGN